MQKQILKFFFLLAIFFLLPNFASAADFHIGTGQPYATIGSFAWSSLVAGDTVYIHARDNQEPYYEHLYVSAALQGTEQNPINIIGVNDGSGNQPILDGRNSTTGPNFDAYGDSQYHSRLGIVFFGPSETAGYGSAPQWITLSNIKIQNYRNVSTTDEIGVTTNDVSGSCVYLQGGQQITLDKLTITGCADGIFGKDNDFPVRYITLQNSSIYDNGVVDDYLYHNIYTEVKYLTMQYNHFGPTVNGSPGNNIKDRSVGFVFRYNWVDGGAHLLDIVECQDNCANHTSDPAWDDVFVYGNIFYAGPGSASQLFHLGTGDTGALASSWRKNLYFYNNTIDYERNQSDVYYMNIFQLSGDQQTVYFDNNIFFAQPETVGQAHSDVYLQYDGSAAPSAYGNMIIGKNWISPDWSVTKPGVTPTGIISGALNIISLIPLRVIITSCHPLVQLVLQVLYQP